MKLKEEDIELLKDLCTRYGVSFEKVIHLIEAVKEYEFKEKKADILDKLFEIIKSDIGQ